MAKQKAPDARLAKAEERGVYKKYAAATYNCEAIIGADAPAFALRSSGPSADGLSR